MIPPDPLPQIIIHTLGLQSVYAVLVFPFIWVLVKLCRGNNPLLQHGLWLLIVLRLVLPPDASFPWSASHLIRSAAQHLTCNVSSISAIAPVPFHSRGGGPGPGVLLPGFSHGGEFQKLSGFPKWPFFKRYPIILSFVFWIWLSVVVLLLGHFFLKRRCFWNIARKAEPLGHPYALDLVRSWQERFHIRRKLQIKVAASDVPAFTIGFIRPCIVLPVHLLHPPGNETLESVVAHELAHVRCFDDPAICLQELVRIAYFFNPLVWYVMPRLNWTREAACDAAVLYHGKISPGSYGRHILACLGHQPQAINLSREWAGFTSTAKGMAFRLTCIQKENSMKPYSLKTYFGIFLTGLFLLPMSPGVASDRNPHGMPAGETPLIQYILDNVPCQNPKEVSRIIWGDLITPGSTTDDLSRFSAATDFDVVADIGDGRKAYVFYRLSNLRRGVYRPGFHFILQQQRLIPIFKSDNVSTYMTEQAKINGRYQISEGWRADLFNGAFDSRVTLAWGTRVWFWTGTKYLPAYTDYTVKKATDSSLLGTLRKWNDEARHLYEEAATK